MSQVSPTLPSALRLASLFHHDPQFAAAVAERAVMRLESAADAQFKRFYYATAQRRSKIHLPRPALLQLLVFTESEPFERLSEQRGAIAPAMMAFRYVKHLVTVSARRNSFHAAVAVCRLLFGYSTAETMAIHGALLHEDERIKEDGYYRARKRLLMAELEQRFTGLVRVRGRAAEERFEPMGEQGAVREAVFAALAVCTPWASPCVAPAPLAARPDDPDVEIDRLHALIHPPCFGALAAHAGVAAADARLAMPRLQCATAGVPESLSKNHTLLSKGRVYL
jgi:hypothetical protein